MRRTGRERLVLCDVGLEVVAPRGDRREVDDPAGTRVPCRDAHVLGAADVDPNRVGHGGVGVAGQERRRVHDELRTVERAPHSPAVGGIRAPELRARLGHARGGAGIDVDAHDRVPLGHEPAAHCGAYEAACTRYSDRAHLA
jgi:hypothetical protein